MLCLGEDGSLLTACSETFMFLSLWNKIAVEDFVILGRMSAEDIASVLLLSKPNECGNCQIQLASFPSLQKKFSISVSPAALLVSKLSTAKELLFLDGTGNSSSEFIQMLYIKNIVESHPIDRLQRLLRRCRFDDAEAFALTFKLDVELVYKENVKQCMELIQPWSASRNMKSDASNFDKFLLLLSKIHDLEFVCEACLNAITVDLTKTQKLLDYARDRIKKEDIKGSHSSKISSLQLSLWNMSNRLNTFLLVYKSDPNSSEWCKFSYANLLDVCKQHLQRGELHQAALVWSRHWSSFKHLLTDDKVKDILDAVSSEVRAPDMLPWLLHFIPLALSAVPESVQHIVNRIIKSIRTLEIEKENWPRSGLNFAEEVLDIMKAKSYSQLEICLSSYKQQYVTATHLKELVAVTNALKDLKHLKDNHKIRISLADFTQTNKKEVVRILLGKVAPMNMQLLMTNFLTEYILNNGLITHAVLSECIHNILNHSANWWYYSTQAPWEETVSAIIACITDNENQINCIISALKVSPVPWSDIMCDIANRGLKLDHPLVKYIRDEYKMMKIKMVQKKYGFPKLCIENCDLYSFIRLIKLILMKGQEGMLEDALKLASISTKMTDETYILCIQHYIEQGNQDKALQLLDSLKPELVIKCCERISLRAQCFLESKRHFVISDLYFEILSSIELRLKKAQNAIDEKSITIEVPIEEMKNCYLLQQKFGKSMSLKEYCHVESCKKLMSECVEELMNSEDVYHVYRKVENLSQLLQLLPQEGVLEMIKHPLNSKNESLVCSIMRDFLHCDSLTKSCSEKVLAMVCQFLEASCNISHKDGGPQLAYNVANEVCTYCTSDSLPSWVELQQWAYTVQNLTALGDGDDNDGFKALATSSQETLTTWRFTPLYRDPAIFSNSTKVLTFLKEVCRQYLHPRSSPDISHITRQLESISWHMQNQQCGVGALRLWCSLTSWALLLSSNTETDCLLSDIEMVAINSAKALLHNVVSSHTLDVTLGLGLLFFLQETFAEDWLKESMEAFKHDLRKLGATVRLGMLCPYNNLQSEYYETINLKCTWAKKLTPYKIPYNMFIELPDQRMNMLRTLMELKEIDISLILEYCSDFELDIQDSLFLYLKTVLLSWEPKFEIEKTVDGEEKLIVHEIDSETEKKCKSIVDLIENKSTLAVRLDDILGKVNYYNYEMYIYIINLLENLSPEHNFISKMLLLTFLKDYKRIQAPKQQELDDWLENFPCSYQLPIFSKWRLPFSTFMDKKISKTLEEELNLNTYKQWCTVLDSLNIQRDNICSIAIKQSFPIRDKTANDSWNVHSQDALLLSQVEECVSSISNLEIASACLYFVTNHISRGADQVIASRLCCDYVLKWYQNDTHARDYVVRVKNKYLHLCTTHTLHKYGLAETCYLKLVSDPQELMSALLQHPGVVSRGKGTTVHCPDINAAVEEIADVHQINSLKFRYDKLEKWLQPYGGIQQSQLDDTTCDLTKLACLPSNVIVADEENLLRACYFLKCSDEKLLAKYLVKIAFKLDRSCEISMALRLRALQCLVVITSEDDLVELTGRKTEEIRQMLKNLTFSSQLEILGLNCSLSHFESCNKMELVKGIWKMQNNNPQALTLIAGLCVEYGIHQKLIWDALLKQMIKFSMVKDLEVLLLCADELGHILSNSLYVQCWESVLLAPFVRDGQEEECIHSLILLQSCPILHNINLSVIVEYSLLKQCPHLAAVILPFLKEAERNSLKQKLTRLKSQTEITQNLKQLIRKGVLIAEQAVPFVHFEEVVEMKGHVE